MNVNNFLEDKLYALKSAEGIQNFLFQKRNWINLIWSEYLIVVDFNKHFQAVVFSI